VVPPMPSFLSGANVNRSTSSQISLLTLLDDVHRHSDGEYKGLGIWRLAWIEAARRMAAQSDQGTARGKRRATTKNSSLPDQRDGTRKAAMGHLGYGWRSSPLLRHATSLTAVTARRGRVLAPP
jgi:hypothetical protein